MKRAAVLFLLIGGLSSNAVQAQWQHPPDIAVISSVGDARLGLVDEAVSFWNKTLQEVGSCFRLGPVTHLVQPVPEEALQSVRPIDERQPRAISIPPALRDSPGDITIFLAASDFLSFTTVPLGPSSKRVIGIKGLEHPPLNMPNVARNVIAQSLGVAIGLRHNSDPRTLMCGRPAPCRPNIFRSNAARIFPLTNAQLRELRRMYPACIA